MTRMMRSPAALVTGLILAIVILPCVGCGGVGKTPEDIFERAKTSAQEKDYETFVDCLTPESQDGLAGVMIQMAAGMLALKDMPEMPGAANELAKMETLLTELETVLDRHNIDLEDLPEGGGLFGMMGMGGSSDELDAIVDGIANKPAFISDMMAAMDEFGQGEQGIDQTLGGELTNVEIDGDHATATLTNVPNQSDSPIEFRKTPKGWRIHIPM